MQIQKGNKGLLIWLREKRQQQKVRIQKIKQKECRSLTKYPSRQGTFLLEVVETDLVHKLGEQFQWIHIDATDIRVLPGWTQNNKLVVLKSRKDQCTNKIHKTQKNSKYNIIYRTRAYLQDTSSKYQEKYLESKEKQIP